MLLNGFSTSFGGTFLYGSPIGSYSNGTYSVSSIYNFTGFYATDNATNYPSGCVSYYFDAPYTGYYQVTDAPCSVEILSKNYYDNTFSDDNYAGMVQMSYDFTYSKPSLPSRFYDSMKNGESGNFKSGKVYIVKGQRYFFNFYLETYYQLSNSSSSFPSYYSVSIDFPAPTITVTDIGSIATINKQTNITINNNTWNGNIYTDNSTNLTYIYPQYTTVNENNETVTNISNNPIIYNNETKQYYTYDSVTNNYYYITYEAPTPSPSPDPTPTPDPGTDPTPTPKPDGSGDVSTPESGKPGSSSGGQSWWEKLLGKIGDAIVDGLLGAISAVLKLIFKLFTTILGWIIWLVSQVLTLFPFLPPGLGALLIGGVVVCFIIGLIKFIRG